MDKDIKKLETWAFWLWVLGITMIIISIYVFFVGAFYATSSSQKGLIDSKVYIYPLTIVINVVASYLQKRLNDLRISKLEQKLNKLKDKEL